MQVLIVDDDMATVDVIQTSVRWKELGVSDTFTAYNIQQAKEVLKEHNIDIVISDIEMPQGSGIDLLEWFRQEEFPGDFLLLTCHESFDYASNAVKYQACEYLLKPFDVNVMEAALKKIILKRMETQKLQENSEYGKWLKENQNHVQVAFWSEVLSGHIAGKKEIIKNEIRNRKLQIDAEQNYNLIVSKITEIKKDRAKMSPDLMLFVVENIHSELFDGCPDNSSVVSMDYDNYYIVATVCRAKDSKELKQCCKLLHTDFKKIFSSEITMCVGRTCKIEEFYEAFHRQQNLIERNVVFYGSYFQEDEAAEVQQNIKKVFEVDKIEQFLSEKKKFELLSYLKERLHERIYDKTLNDQVLSRGKEEILQTVYTYFGKEYI